MNDDAEETIEDENRDPMVIHDSVEKSVYTPKMEGGYDPEEVCRKISSKIETAHTKGLSKKDFFPTFLISEMAQDANHGWAKEEGHYGFIYGYIFGYMLASFEKNKGTKLEWENRPMNEAEIAESQDLSESVDREVNLTPEETQRIIKQLGINPEDLKEAGEWLSDPPEDTDFDPPEPWTPDSLEGYDPTK